MQQTFEKWRGQPVDTSDVSLDRRTDVRHVAVRWPAQLAAAGEDCAPAPCVVHNICATTLVAEIFAPRSTGEQLRIDLGDAQHLNGTIVWANDVNIEIRLDEPVDVNALIEQHGGTSPGSPQLAISCQGWLELGKEAFMVEVCDLSQTGARIAANAAPAVGQHTLLLIHGLAPISGEVRWRDDGKLGIAFDEPVPFDTLTGWIVSRDDQVGSHGQSRRWPRYSILLKTVARLKDVVEPVEALVHNISRGGVLLSCRRGLRAGDTVELGLGLAGSVAGHVTWVGQAQAGIEFTRTIDAEHVLHPLGGRGIPPVLHHHVIGRRPGLNSHRTH